jgi:hypothetical protein
VPAPGAEKGREGSEEKEERKMSGGEERAEKGTKERDPGEYTVMLFN